MCNWNPYNRKALPFLVAIKGKIPVGEGGKIERGKKEKKEKITFGFTGQGIKSRKSKFFEKQINFMIQFFYMDILHLDCTVQNLNRKIRNKLSGTVQSIS